MDETITSILQAPVEVIGGFAALLVLLLAFSGCGRASVAIGAASRGGRSASRPPIAGTPDGDAEVRHGTCPRIVAYPMPVIGLIEERVYDELEDIASQSIMGHRVLTQLSLSAFLYAGSSGLSRADENRVIAHLAGLQVDFLIVDADWQPVVAVNIERDEGSASDALEEEAKSAQMRAWPI
jgi:hypothetical protein